MSVESFLHFWSHYNTRIIEVLVGLILLCLVYLAYRTFLAPLSTDETATGAGAGREELEKTLARILETQKAGAGPQLSDAESSAEIQRLKGILGERDTLITELRAELEKASQTSAAEAPPAGLDAEEKSKLEGVIKDLEARLAEYEIISEDIADLSFYKEENSRLQKELEALKGGAAPQAAAPAPEPTPEPTPEVESAPEPAPEPVEAPAASDSVLAEMAATAEANPPVEPPDDDSHLMNQFENFVKKG